jgi:Retroviral aspartyl protease
MSVTSWLKKEGALSVGIRDTGLTNVLKTTMTRRKARKCLKRRWTEGSSMLMYGPCSRRWQKKIEMSFWRAPKKWVFKEESCLNISISLSRFYSVTIANISRNSIYVPINIGSSKQTVKALIDSGAGGLFIDQNFAKNFEINYLDEPVKAYNMDGMENKWETINAYINLEFKLGDWKFNEHFYVTGLRKQRIILGFPWLHKYNLIINWTKGEVTFKPFQINWKCLIKKGKQIQQEWQPKIEEVVDNEELRNRTTLPIKENKMGVYIRLLETDVWIHKTNITMELAIEENSKKMDKTDKQLVPVEYHEYLDIFSEEKAHCFPESRPWDHKIKMKEEFEPKSFKNYNLTPAEQIELNKFLKENLEKGYIWPSQSPMASPFFFVSKKDGKLWPFQDYQYLNDWTVKNSYPLLLISEIMDKLKGAKYFTKLAVLWGYNNVRIRKGDK